MRQFLAAGVIALAALAQAGAAADDTLKSGLQVGKSPTPFHPLHLTGDQAGEKQCLV